MCLLAAGTTVVLSILGFPENMTLILSGAAVIMNTIYMVVMALATIHISRLNLPTAVKLTLAMKYDKVLASKRYDTWISTVFLALVGIGCAIFGVSSTLLLFSTIAALICGWRYFTHVGIYHEELTDISNNK